MARRHADSVQSLVDHIHEPVNFLRTLRIPTRAENNFSDEKLPIDRS